MNRASSSIIVIACMALASCSSTDGVLYADLRGEPFDESQRYDIGVLDENGEDRLLKSITVRRSAGETIMALGDGVYFIDHSGQLSVLNLDNLSVRRAYPDVIDAQSPVEDFRIAPDGTAYVLRGGCSSGEGASYDCQLVSYPPAEGGSAVLRQLEPVGTWGRARLIETDSGSIVYKLSLSENGDALYNRVFQDGRTDTLLSVLCEQSLEPERTCVSNDFGSGYVEKKQAASQQCGRITISRDQWGKTTVQTKKGTREAHPEFYRLLGCYDRGTLSPL